MTTCHRTHHGDLMTRTRKPAAATIALIVMAAAMFLLPAQPVTGVAPAGVGYTHVEPTDTAQGKTIPEDWFYPIGDTGGLSPAAFQIADQGVTYGQHLMPGVHAGGLTRIVGRYPLIVFSHGTAGHGIQNYSMYRDLALQGFVVVAVTHPEHSLLYVGRGLTLDNFNQTQLHRNLDLKFAITNAVTWFDGSGNLRLDPNDNPMIATIGHSQGAMTALTQVSGLGLEPYVLPDPRIDAVVSISPSRYLMVLGGWPTSTGCTGVTPPCTPAPRNIPDLLASIHTPVLIISQRADGITPTVFSDQVQAELTGTTVDRLDIAGTEHNATTDLLALGPDVQSSTAPQSVKDLVTGLSDQICADNTDSCVRRTHALQADAIAGFLHGVFG